MPIPKKIHYVWLNGAPLPKEDAVYIEGWRKLHPDYEIRLWTENDVDMHKYPLVAKALKERRWALASDIIRMYVIYEEGGFYLDTDVELVKSLEEFRQYDAVAGWESNYWFTTAVFGAKKHSPWIGKILKRYEFANDKKITTATFLKTVHSASVYAKDIYGLKLDGKTRVYGDKALAVFAREYFSPKHYITGELNITKNTVAIHRYASTWHGPLVKLKDRMMRLAFCLFGERGYAKLERHYNTKLERKIRKELP